MKIVVTGSKGFVGSLLVKRLEEKGHEVFGLDQPRYDIRDPNIDCCIPADTDVIIHLASVSTDKVCRERPYDCFDINVLGTLRLIEAAKDLRVKQFIFASSEWVYGESDKEKDEGAFINTMALGEYALSKHVSEVNLLQNFMKTDMPTTVFRFGIIYGPRETNWSVVETLFNAVRTSDKVTVGSLQTGRNYVHVEDVVSGIIASLGMGGYHIVNLTGDDFVTLKEIIAMSEAILQKNVEVIQNVMTPPSIRKVKNLKAKMILNWTPKFDLKKGLETLI